MKTKTFEDELANLFCQLGELENQKADVSAEIADVEAKIKSLLED